MQKNLINLFFKEDSISNIFLRMKLLVVIMLITITSVLAKNPSKSSKLTSDPKTNETELQQVVVAGTVTDLQGLPLTGVTVVVKGTTLGVLTDGSGKYTLTNIPQNATLVFTFIGMAPQEIPLNGRTLLDVLMKETTLTLDEVVVIGYGVQKKESIVGAIAQTTNADLQKSGNVTDLTQALTGHLPGVVTAVNSGEPGGVGRGTSATQIYIRGRNTWNGGQALILVDGAERRMDDLDMSEVENISILKDASATAVFGVKGANGVILITTKRGGLGKPKISFTYNSTALFLSKLPQEVNSFDAITARNQSIERETPVNEPSWADYIPYPIAQHYKQPQSASDALIYPDVNWVNATFKDPSYSHRATVNMQGGTKFVSYFGSLSYLHEGDMFNHYDNHHGYDASYAFNRFNFRSNLDFNLTSTTKLSVNLSGFWSQKNSAWDNEGFTGWNNNGALWVGAYGFPPDLYLPQYPDGRFGYSPKISAYTSNPAASINNLGVRRNYTTMLNSDFAIEQKLDFVTKGLKFKGTLYYDNQIISQEGIYDAGNHIRPGDGGNVLLEYVDPSLYTGVPGQDPSQYTSYYPATGTNQFDYVVRPWTLQGESVAGANWVWSVPVDRKLEYQLSMDYARNFGRHNISALAMFQRQQIASGSEFVHFREDWVFRVTYDYDSRYLFEANGAYNGSEQFGPGYRFAFFPSVAVGWVVSNEKFFKVDWMNRLKVRYSVGKVGDDNVTGGGRWLYADQYSYGGFSIMNSNPNLSNLPDGTRAPESPYTWYKMSQLGNPNINWEKALKNNFGLEMGLFKNMISVNADYFTEDRTDILIAGSSRNIPPYFGMTPPSANLGRVTSHGWELELKFDKRQPGGFHYWGILAITTTKNKVMFRDDPQLYAPYLKAAGFPIGQQKQQIRSGFYNNWDDIYASVPRETNDLYKLPGFYNVLDFNADGIIKSADDSEPEAYGSVPIHTFNYSIGADYKGFSAMVQFYGANDMSRSMSLSNFSGQLDILFKTNADYWSKDNQNAPSYLPKWRASGSNTGDFWLWDASYMRLKTVEIAYSLQDKLIKRLGLGGVRIYLNGNNLLFWSKLPDDREATDTGNTGAAGGNGTGGASAGAYPTTRRVNLGIDLTF